ncbi:MAG: hypothetical protein Q7S22_03955 [Candidatus Micrarchaeota archaeon]|nr:hypothetical protein [Candidatus Micrarchaeota archaeon]
MLDENDFSTLPGTEIPSVQPKPTVQPVPIPQPIPEPQPVSAVGPTALKNNLPDTEKPPQKSGNSMMIAIAVILVIGLLIIGLIIASVYLGYVKLPNIDLTFLSSILGGKAIDEKAKANAEAAISDANNAISQAEAIGADISSARTALDKAEKELSSDDFPAAINNANDAANKAKQAEKIKQAEIDAEKKKNDTENEMPPPLPDEV